MRKLEWTLVCVAVLSACSTNRQGAQNSPIRVLVVTATQGFRHTDAIATSTQRLKDAQSGSDLRFDFTEDPSMLNAANLALTQNNACFRHTISDI